MFTKLERSEPFGCRNRKGCTDFVAAGSTRKIGVNHESTPPTRQRQGQGQGRRQRRQHRYRDCYLRRCICDGRAALSTVIYVPASQSVHEFVAAEGDLINIYYADLSLSLCGRAVGNCKLEDFYY